MARDEALSKHESTSLGSIYTQEHQDVGSNRHKTWYTDIRAIRLTAGYAKPAFSESRNEAQRRGEKFLWVWLCIAGT